MRTFDEKVRSRAKRYVTRVSDAICRAFGARCETEFKTETYPVTSNNSKLAVKVARSLKEISGTHTVECDPILGAEDFSRFLQKAPGVYYFLGTGNKKKGCVYPNHSARFKVDEDVLKYGAVSLAKLAFEFGSD
jgi:carboxypeptidase Ss1